MPRISRAVYQNAIASTLRDVGFTITEITLGKLLAVRKAKVMYIDVAGKNFPYFGHGGQKAFLWETHIRPDRLDEIEKAAKSYKAEPWLAFSYWILEPSDEKEFNSVTNVQDKRFGARFIRTSEYRKHMQPRSPSWAEVELPRKLVYEITLGSENL